MEGRVEVGGGDIFSENSKIIVLQYKTTIETITLCKEIRFVSNCDCHEPRSLSHYSNLI